MVPSYPSPPPLPPLEEATSSTKMIKQLRENDDDESPLPPQLKNLEDGEIPECDYCRNKLEVRKVFPRTYEYIVETFGEEHLELLMRKGVFPYDYLRDWSVLEETSLPPESAFFNTLTNQPISSEDFQHARDVWDKLGFVNLGQYAEAYLICDVLLLGSLVGWLFGWLIG